MISARAADVAAMPIHGPFTRHMRSFGNLTNASIRFLRGSLILLFSVTSGIFCVKSLPELRIRWIRVIDSTF